MADSRGFFVAGTDTDVGKTYGARLLVDGFAAKGKATYQKPVQTGCVRDGAGNLHAPDFDTVAHGKMVQCGSIDEHVPYRFEPACSPHLAAQLAGTVISLDHIRHCYFQLSAAADFTVVEGAGGVLAPLCETTYIIDLIVYLNLPVVLVTSLRLGTINHTFLTLRVLRESGIRLAGIVGNHTDEKTPAYIYRDNARMIRAHTHPAPFLEVPFGGGGGAAIEEFVNALIN